MKKAMNEENEWDGDVEVEHIEGSMQKPFK
jgi:hypothetical protein